MPRFHAPSDRADVYARVTGEMITAIESGTLGSSGRRNTLREEIAMAIRKRRSDRSGPVLGALEALLNRPAQPRRAGQFAQRDTNRRKGKRGGPFVGLPPAAPDQKPVL